MNKLLLSLAAVAALSAAAPALAQPWGEYQYRHDHDHGPYGGRLTTGYVDGLAWKIDNAARHGVISWRQDRDLRAELRTMQPLAWRVQTNRAQPWEIRRLSEFVDRVDAVTTRYAENAPRHWGR